MNIPKNIWILRLNNNEDTDLHFVSQTKAASMRNRLKENSDMVVDMYRVKVTTSTPTLV